MIRPLLEKDAERMSICLNDDSVTFFMPIRNRKITKDSCINFIKSSKDDKTNKNFAIVDEGDNWIGTISLKNIDYDNKEAEYAIITSNEAHGKGYAQIATKEILSYAFKTLGLNKVYLYVAVINERANKFYNKFGFKFDRVDKELIEINGKKEDINWYYLLKEDEDKYVQ